MATTAGPPPTTRRRRFDDLPSVSLFQSSRIAKLQKKEVRSRMNRVRITIFLSVLFIYASVGFVYIAASLDRWTRDMLWPFYILVVRNVTVMLRVFGAMDPQNIGKSAPYNRLLALIVLFDLGLSAYALYLVFPESSLPDNTRVCIIFLTAIELYPALFFCCCLPSERYYCDQIGGELEHLAKVHREQTRMMGRLVGEQDQQGRLREYQNCVDGIIDAAIAANRDGVQEREARSNSEDDGAAEQGPLLEAQQNGARQRK